jgi:hypothetical protein
MALKRGIMVLPPLERVPVQGLLATLRGFFVGQGHGVLRSVPYAYAYDTD